jgi:hypothetical protein
MIDKKTTLVHFGNCCAPGIIINDILNIKDKQLFQLGLYNFNDILEYLKESKYEEIYDKSHLFFHNVKITEFYSRLNEYKTGSIILNKKYNFGFNHDYVMQGYKIMNYEFIVNSFNIKIKNFKECLELEKKIIFITFTNVDIKALEMIDLLKEKTNNWFKLIIFTSNKNLNYCFDKVELIYLNNEYNNWFLKSPKDRLILYTEIYNKFYKTVNEYIKLSFFEDTFYYKSLYNL